MNAEIRKLPVGIQSFEDIRKNEYVYVDKTALMYRNGNRIVEMLSV